MRIAAAVFWTFGDLGRVSWQENGLMAAVVGGAIVYFLFMRWNYNAMANGEELAKSLGVKSIPGAVLGLLVCLPADRCLRGVYGDDRLYRLDSPPDYESGLSGRIPQVFDAPPPR